MGADGERQKLACDVIVRSRRWPVVLLQQQPHPCKGMDHRSAPDCFPVDRTLDVSLKFRRGLAQVMQQSGQIGRFG